MSGSGFVDVVVVGAGAAGIAAARRLVAAGVSTLVLEAKPWIGGRTVTDHETFGFPYDLGAFWLTGYAENPWRRIADDLGVRYADRYFPGAGMPLLFPGRWATAEENAAKRDYAHACFDAIHTAGTAGHDIPCSDVIDRGSPWYDAFAAWAGMLHNRPLSELSTLDQSRSIEWEAGPWLQVLDGYGTLVARYAAGLPIVIEAPVEEITWGGEEVAVRSRAGVVRCRAAIVTVPTGVLAAEAIRFAPALPDTTLAAIAALPMGVVNRIAVQFDRDLCGEFGEAGYAYVNGPDDAIFVMTKLLGHNLALGYVGCGQARRLEAAADRDAVDLLLRSVRAAFGGDPERSVLRWRCTRWASDPYARGSYAQVRPGQTAQRQALAAPVANRLFFAGEATSERHFALADGAFLEGERAACEALAAIGGEVSA